LKRLVDKEKPFNINIDNITDDILKALNNCEGKSIKDNCVLSLISLEDQDEIEVELSAMLEDYLKEFNDDENLREVEIKYDKKLKTLIQNEYLKDKNRITLNEDEIKNFIEIVDYISAIKKGKDKRFQFR
jgi:hypothetical protein